MSEDKPDKRRVPLWVKLLLGVSLALNLAVVGLVSGVVARLGGSGPGTGALNYAMPYVMALPRDDRREVAGELRRGARDGRLPTRRDRRAQYGQMLEVLRSDPFDRDRALSILAAQGRDADLLQTSAQDIWLSRIERLGPEARAAYADRLEDILSKRGKRK